MFLVDPITCQLIEEEMLPIVEGFTEVEQDEIQLSFSSNFLSEFMYKGDHLCFDPEAVLCISEDVLLIAVGQDGYGYAVFE